MDEMIFDNIKYKPTSKYKITANTLRQTQLVNVAKLLGWSYYMSFNLYMKNFLPTNLPSPSQKRHYSYGCVCCEL